MKKLAGAETSERSSFMPGVWLTGAKLRRLVFAPVSLLLAIGLALAPASFVRADEAVQRVILQDSKFSGNPPLGTAANPLINVALGNSNIGHNQVTIATTATQIVPAHTRGSVTFINHGTTDVFIGGSGVTILNGGLLPGVKGASFTLNNSAAIYGIVGSGTQIVSYVESY